VGEDTIAVARACYDAYVKKDRRAIEALVAEDFHLISPVDNRLDRTTCIQRCWPNSSNIGKQIVDVNVYFGWSIPHEAP
jgi:hypothetical protein